MEGSDWQDGSKPQVWQEARIGYGIQWSRDGIPRCWSSHRQVVPKERHRSPNDLKIICPRFFKSCLNQNPEITPSLALFGFVMITLSVFINRTSHCI